MPRPSIHTPEKKAAMLVAARQMLREGVKRKDVAAQLGINVSSLSGWLREETINRLLPPVEPSRNPRARR